MDLEKQEKARLEKVNRLQYERMVTSAEEAEQMYQWVSQAQEHWRDAVVKAVKLAILSEDLNWDTIRIEKNEVAVYMQEFPAGRMSATDINERLEDLRLTFTGIEEVPGTSRPQLLRVSYRLPSL